jgi:hypothetical protein
MEHEGDEQKNAMGTGEVRNQEVILIVAWVCGRSLVGIAGSNPTEGMDVCLL